ncbi:LPS export ABC transporter permease LptG [Pseudomonas putida]|uniref:LPS export ABC transporter permease LptG n=1 Tax=Pseudomonas putida TaxID=303 RepID=UPI00390692C5
MNLFFRYLTRNVFIGFAAAASLLIPLFSTFDLINELDDVSSGGYRWTQAVAVVLLTLPRRLVDLGPFIALLGGIVGLGQLVVSQELTAMRAAGMPIVKIALAAVCAGALLTLSLSALDEWVASPLQQRALQMRNAAINRGDDTPGSKGTLWARQGNQVARVETLATNDRPVNIEVFDFATNLTLTRYIHAEHATVLEGGIWKLENVNLKQWHDGRQTQTTLDHLQWPTIFSTSQLRELTLPSESFAIEQLIRYIRFLDHSGQPFAQYSIALWQKLARPILTLAMILLAIPFTFTQQRAPGMGSRLAIGASIGLLTYVGSQIIANLGLLWAIPAPLTTLLPPLVMLGLALLLVLRFDRHA